MSSFCKCGSEKKYNEIYDSIYCELCNKWLEEKCNDEKCEYCAERPDTPSQAETFSHVGQ
jgi:hypothetical protein